MLSKSAYAEHRGVSPSAVTRALAERRIKVTVINGKEWLDVEATDAAWDMSTRPRRDALPPSPRGPIDRPEQDVHHELKLAALSLQRARAEQANLELDRAAGILVLRADVEWVLKDAGALWRQLLEAMPIHLAPRLVGLADMEAMRGAIEDYATEMAESLVTELKRRADRL